MICPSCYHNTSKLLCNWGGIKSNIIYVIDSCKRGSTPWNPVVPLLRAYFDVGVTALSSLFTELCSCSPVRIVTVNCYIMLNKAFYVPGEYSKYLFGKPKQISVVTD